MWRLACFLLYSLFILSGEARSHVGFNNHNATRTHKLSDGSVIDCIRIEDQPSLQHAHMKNHVVVKSPPKAPWKPYGVSGVEKAKPCRKTQLFHHEVGSCEPGFIPILHSGGNKELTSRLSLARNKVSIGPQVQFLKLFVAKAQRLGRNTGGIGSIQLPGVHEVDYDGDMSMTSITVMAPSCTVVESGSEIVPNWLEAGYLVAPMVFTEGGTRATTDSQVEAGKGKVKANKDPHLYIYSEGFKDDPRLSCLNLDCGGFVQLAEHTVVGGKITAAMDSFLDFEIYLSTDDGPLLAKWWLTFNHEVIGYWPHESIYHGGKCLDAGSEVVQWGGQVVLTDLDSTTSMGSGRKGSRGFGQAAYISNLRVYVPNCGPDGACNGTATVVPVAEDLGKFEDDPDHFDVLADFNNTYGKYPPLLTGVYYGGNMGSTV